MTNNTTEHNTEEKKGLLRQIPRVFLSLFLLLAILFAGVTEYLMLTEYRPPAEKVVDLYVSGFGDQEGLNAWLENVRQTEMPENGGLPSGGIFRKRLFKAGRSAGRPGRR